MSPARRSEDGFTLIELIVSMSVMMVLLAVTFSAVMASNNAVATTSQQQGLNEEARQAINRMARDLRQATKVTTAVNPDGPAFSATGLTAIRLAADFDGDGCVAGVVPVPAPVPAPTSCLAYNGGNPEDITYCFEPSSRQLYVIDNSAAGVVPVSTSSTACTGGQPLLAGNVKAFAVEYRSNDYHQDLSPSDGVTTWREVDEAGPPSGNTNGLLDTELASVDSVVLKATMELGGKAQVYRTHVDLRNRSQ